MNSVNCLLKPNSIELCTVIDKHGLHYMLRVQSSQKLWKEQQTLNTDETVT